MFTNLHLKLSEELKLLRCGVGAESWRVKTCLRRVGVSFVDR